MEREIPACTSDQAEIRKREGEGGLGGDKTLSLRWSKRNGGKTGFPDSPNSGRREGGWVGKETYYGVP